MKNKNTRLIISILFFGSIWGIAEATLGHLLHLLNISILWSGAIMFPIAAYILLKAYAVLRSKMSLFYIGIVAATIKAFDFLLPFRSAFKIINPMVSIVFESLLVVALVGMFDKDDLKNKMLAMPLASVAWRGAYLLYMGIQYLATGFVSDYLVSFEAAISFTVLYGVLSGIILDAFVLLETYVNSHKKHSWHFNIASMSVYAAITLLTFITAIVLTIGL